MASWCVMRAPLPFASASGRIPKSVCLFRATRVIVRVVSEELELVGGSCNPRKGVCVVRMLAPLALVVELALSATAFGLPSTAIPVTCSGDANSESAYRSGFEAGRRLVQRAWHRIEDCGQLEQFLKVMRSNIGSYKSRAATAYAICRYTGMVDGANEELLRIQASCR